MSSTQVRAVVSLLRSWGVVVHEWPNWATAGNGQTSAYMGGIIHHTASAYGSALPGTGIGGVLRNGRSDLSGPLCNFAGNSDGSLTVISAGPANHAGASGGRSNGPFPVTSSFNRLVMGLEIVYPGTSAMTSAQYATATAWGAAVARVLGRSSEYIRGHYETSVTGKWDPGYANGKSIDMAAFRAAVARRITTGGSTGMELNSSYTDWAGNRQTVQSTFNNIDKRTAEIHAALLGLQKSRIPGDSNKTNVVNAVMDSTSWTNQDLGLTAKVLAQLAALEAKVDKLAQGKA